MHTQNPILPLTRSALSRVSTKLLAVLVIPAMACSLHAETSLTAHWNPNPEPDIAGYKVHIGTSSGNYTTVKDVTGGTSVVLSGLANSTTYYCAVQAYNTSGLVSELSDEVSRTTAAENAPEIAVTTSAALNLTSGTGSVSFDSGRTETFTITNSGTASLTGLAVTTEGSASADFVASTLESTTLAPGTSMSFSVMFQPSATGSRVATLKIASNDTDESPFLVNLAGNGYISSPDIDVAFNGGATTLNDFGQVYLGGESAAQVVTIFNRGTADLAIASPAITGVNSADFIVSSPATSTLAPGTSTTFNVMFRPTATGSRVATLSIASNDSDENPLEFGLSGTGLGTTIVATTPEIEVSATGVGTLTDNVGTIDFGSANSGAKGSTRTVTIHNTGNGNLSGLQLALRGENTADFKVTAFNNAELLPGESRSFRITFRPHGSGVRTASISIMSNDADEGQFDIALTGYSKPAPAMAIKVDGDHKLGAGDALVSFTGTGSTMTFTITNRGSATLNGLSLKLTGLNPSDFTHIPLKKKSLAPGKSTTFKVTFSSSASRRRWAMAKVTSNDPKMKSFNIVLTGKRGTSATAHSAEIKDAPIMLTAATEQAERPVVSVMIVDGQKYRCITIPKVEGQPVNPRLVEVSGNLENWSSGGKHTTVIKDNAAILKVRDNTPLTPGTKRFIRLNIR